MTKAEIENYLRFAPDNFRERRSDVGHDLKELKVAAIGSGDQEAAKYFWCLETILEIQDCFIEAFLNFANNKFYDGWNLLERAEIALGSLDHHFLENSNEFQIALIREQVPKYQSLFPYNIFASPEFLEIEKICSICRQPVLIRHPCGHRVGEIYNGELCNRIVTKCEVLGVAMVKCPTQKYSVVFIHDKKTGKTKDNYDYSLVKFISDRLKSPFHAWNVTWSKIRHPHSKFKHTGRNDPCPCGSEKKYKKCCLTENGVLRPHCQFSLEVLPPPERSSFEYSD